MSNAASTDVSLCSMPPSTCWTRKRVALPSVTSATACPSGRATSSLTGSTLDASHATRSASSRSPRLMVETPAATPTPSPNALIGATTGLSAGRSTSSRSMRRRRYSSTAASTPAAGTTTGIVFGVSRVKVPTASCRPADDRTGGARHGEPVAARPCRGPGQLLALTLPEPALQRDPAPIAATSSATDMRPHATLSERWFVLRSATRAVDWIVSCTSETIAWFVAIERPGDDRLVDRRARHERALERQRDVRRGKQHPRLVRSVTERLDPLAARHGPSPLRR